MTHLEMGPGGHNATLPWYLPYLQGQPHAVDIPNHAFPLLLLIQEAVAHCPKCLPEQILHVLELCVVVDTGQRQCHHGPGVCGILESLPRLRNRCQEWECGSRGVSYPRRGGSQGSAPAWPGPPMALERHPPQPGTGPGCPGPCCTG